MLLSSMFESSWESFCVQAGINHQSHQEKPSRGTTGAFTQGFTRDLRMLNITWDLQLFSKILEKSASWTAPWHSALKGAIEERIPVQAHLFKSSSVQRTPLPSMVLTVFELMPPQLVINRIKWWKMSFFQENLMEPSGGPSGSISTRLQKTTPIQVPLVLCPNQGRTVHRAGSWAPFASAPTSTRRGRGDKHRHRRKLTFIRHSRKTLSVEVKIDDCCYSLGPRRSHPESWNALKGFCIFLSHTHVYCCIICLCLIGLQHWTSSYADNTVNLRVCFHPVMCRLFGLRTTRWPGNWRKSLGRIHQRGLWTNV